MFYSITPVFFNPQIHKPEPFSIIPSKHDQSNYSPLQTSQSSTSPMVQNCNLSEQNLTKFSLPPAVQQEDNAAKEYKEKKNY